MKSKRIDGFERGVIRSDTCPHCNNKTLIYLCDMCGEEVNESQMTSGIIFLKDTFLSICKKCWPKYNEYLYELAEEEESLVSKLKEKIIKRRRKK